VLKISYQETKTKMEIIKLGDQLLLEFIHNTYNIALSEIFSDINLKSITHHYLVWEKLFIYS